MLILLVEDDADVASLIEELLQRDGHEVVRARTGDDAMALFRDARPRPDAMVADNCLPDMLGWEVADYCRTIAPNFPIVICSAACWLGAKRLDTVVRVEKPFTRAMLLDGLARAVERA